MAAEFFFCHAGLGIMPKTKFRQARHASRGLPNWTKYYSILCRLSWSTRDITEIIIWTLGFDNELIADAQKVSKVKLVTLNLAVTKPMALFQKIESMLIRLSYNDRGAWSRYVFSLATRIPIFQNSDSLFLVQAFKFHLVPPVTQPRLPINLNHTDERLQLNYLE